MTYQNNNEFTVESALLAQKEGLISDWVQALLHCEDSDKLAKSLAEFKPVAMEIYDFPLLKLKRIDGPEEKIEQRLSPDIWEAQVSLLTNKIKEGFRPAPLIVTDYWNYFEIADGNHRHEALLRNGITSYWTIFLIKNKKGHEYLKESLDLHEN